MKTILTVAAVVVNEKSEVLLVRKRGSDTFIQPGGKPDAGEEAIAALARELQEELGVNLVSGSTVSLGTFEDAAVNEPGCRVRAEAYLAKISGPVSPQAEIEEYVWTPIDGPFCIKVAPLSTRHILPAAVAHRAARSAERRYTGTKPRV